MKKELYLIAILFFGLACNPSSSTDPGLDDQGVIEDSGISDTLCGGPCTSPPASYCDDDKTRVYYDSDGHCVEGQCVYTKQTETCSEQCISGVCGDPIELYVDANNSGNEDGTIQAPYRTISAALASTANPAFIFVAQGNYQEELDIRGRAIELTGGYLGASTADYKAGKSGDFTTYEPTTQITRVDAPIGPTVRVSQTGALKLSGMIITGAGRGVECETSSLAIFDSQIKGNHVPELNGGGVFTSECTFFMENSIVSENIGLRGGGIATEGGKIGLEDNDITNNEGKGDHGGGLYLVSGDLTFYKNRVEGNSVGISVGYGWGGGIALIGMKGSLSYNTVSANKATTYGSGVFVDDGSIVSLKNELYFENYCADGGAAIYVDGLNETTFSKAEFINITVADHQCQGGLGQGILVEASDVKIRNAIFWNNGPSEIFLASGTLDIRYSNAPTQEQGEGNISQAPLFVVDDNAKYHLRSKAGHWDGSDWVNDSETSPCIDSGDPNDSFSSEQTPNGGRINMGVYGGTAQASRSE